MLQCKALGDCGTRKIGGKDGKPTRELRWQNALFKQGVEVRQFRMELPDGQPYLEAGTDFVLHFNFDVNQYGDLMLKRGQRIEVAKK
jgi:hypothetical protein